MTRARKRILICAAIVAGSVAATMQMEKIPFFHLLHLKAQDAHFVLRGPRQTHNIVVVGIDDKALSHYSELLAFWQPYYADAMRAVALGGGRVMVLDVAFGVSVDDTYKVDNDHILAGAFQEVLPTMPVVCAFVATADSEQADKVPINMMSSVFGMNAYANLTADNDDFVRLQELFENPKAGVATEGLTRGMALRAAEKFLGRDIVVKDGKVFLAGREIPLDDNRNLIINYAGPADTVPHVSLYDVVSAYRNKDKAQLENWFRGNAVLLGPENIDDRHATPFYTAFTLSKKWRTAGVEVHANVLNTLLTGDFLKPVPDWARVLALTMAATLCIYTVVRFAIPQAIAWSSVVLLSILAGTHLLFRQGWLLSTSQTLLAYLWALFGGIVYRFATAESKSRFFRKAVALFVGKQVATSLDKSHKISL